MSSDPRNPDDRELDAFLRSEDATSRAYANTKDAQPPADLDTAVLNFARAAARTSRAQSRLRRWQRPLALAAVLTLSMGVLLQLWKEPQVRNPVVAREETSRAADTAPAAAQAQAELSASAMAAPDHEAASKSRAESEIENTARKQKSSAKKSRAPEQAAPNPPPPPPAITAAIAAPPSVATESAPTVTSAPAAAFTPPTPKPDSRPMPAPAMGAAASDAMSDTAAGLVKREDATQERRKAVESESVQRSFAQRKEQPRSAAAAQYAEPKKLQERTTSWRAPVFDTLQLGVATRADVRSRYGEPSSQGLSSPDDKNPDRRELLYDFYDRLPGQTGVFEFYYERLSLRLLTVRRVLKPAVKTQALIAELGWTEIPIVSDWQHPPCAHAAVAGLNDSSQPPLYWRYPGRGGYVFLPKPGSVEQVIFEAACDLTAED